MGERRRSEPGSARGFCLLFTYRYGDVIEARHLEVQHHDTTPAPRARLSKKDEASVAAELVKRTSLGVVGSREVRKLPILRSEKQS